jgi:hypothetical protein
MQPIDPISKRGEATRIGTPQISLLISMTIRLLQA